jgi:hypothetical protein
MFRQVNNVTAGWLWGLSIILCKLFKAQIPPRGKAILA